MNIALSGSTGLVGSSVVKALTARGDTVLPIVRDDSNGIQWDATTYAVRNPERLTGIDAVIHLAGESIVGRWTPEKKKRIYDSRINSTAALSQTLAGLASKPKVLIVASATGYYGDRGQERLTEDDISGSGFLADVVKDWEAAADPARAAGIRVVHVRFGMLLSKDGGALKTMLTPFKLGLGGVVGSGKQYLGWASLEDAVGAMLFALDTDSLEGAVNVVAPGDTTNRDLTKALGDALSRPTIFPVPASIARSAFGEMADALLLASQRVVPQRLRDHGYLFKHTDLNATLQELLNSDR